MIEVYEPEITEEDVEAVSVALRSGWINEHNRTKEFEERFAEYVGTKYAVTSTNGTMALFMALKAANVGETSLVAVPVFTAIGTIRAIQLAGAGGILIDVDGDGNIDVEKAMQANASHVMVVHNNGYPCEIDELVYHFGKEYVIEDACQSIGSRLSNGKHLGTTARVGGFSLSTTKILTGGQGGVVVTDDDETYVELQRWKNQGNFRRVDPPDTYTELGYNFKWTEMNAALALSQMGRLPQKIRSMYNIIDLYGEYIDVPCPPDGVLPWRITVMVPSSKREQIVNYMRMKGVNVQPFPQPITHHMGELGFPHAEKYASEGIYLPSSPSLSDDNVKYICEVFKEATK